MTDEKHDLRDALQPSTAITPSENVGAIAAAAREDSEIKAAILVAKGMPRVEEEARQKLIRSCRRESFADATTYSFPRGGGQVTGPSVDLAREAARCWGNMRHGVRIVSKDEDYIHVVGWALDLESNTFVGVEDKFRRIIQRKGKGWIVPDERDERELQNKRGAICVRNAILQLMPPDLIDDALEQAAKTMEAVAQKTLAENPDDARKKMVDAFDKLGVTPSMIEGRLGHPLSVVTPSELADLKRVFKSLRDGNSKREEYFAMPETAATRQAKTLDALVDKERGK